MQLPRDVNCSADVLSSLRITDGALLVVDIKEGPSDSLEKLLLYTMQE